MFVVRNYVVTGRKNSGGRIVSASTIQFCLSCGLKSGAALPTEEDVLLGQSLSGDS